MNRILFILLLIPLFSLQAQDEDQGWTPTLQMKFRSISGTAVSADGKYVAYVIRTPIMTEDKSEYNQQIWVAATDGSFDEQYTRGEKSNYAPAFSPDSRSIAFISTRQDKPQVWVMRLMGGEPRQVTDVPSGVSRFSWSPDGQRIAFLQKDPETDEEEKAKKELTDVILVDQNYKYSHLYTIGLSENDSARQITSGSIDILSFDFSPDGQQIVFDYRKRPTINEGFMNSSIAVVLADSGKVTPLVDRPGNNSRPKYSPDGKYIAFSTTNGKPEPVGLSDLAIVSIADKKITNLPYSYDRQAALVDWIGDQLYYSEDEGTATVLKSMSVNKSSKKAELSFQTDDNSLMTVSGVAGQFSINANGAIAMSYQTLTQPEEVYFKSEGSADPKQLSHVNDDIEYGELAKTEIIQWKSRDGKPVEGLLTYPIGYEKGKRYPVILNVHGGPNGVFSQRFTGRPSIYMLQYFAQQGYVIVQPNPRGSSGYGKDFRYDNFQDWGYGDFDDVVTGVDHAIAMGVADPYNQFLMGWSYGGYMTSFAVTKTDRFNAASMGAGLPNLLSMTTTTDIPDYLVAHMGGEYWDDYETYEKHSAMYHIKNVTTPTQVIHGQNDLRVPFTQGQEFYVALQRLGIDTEMIVYPRTPHGPREPKFLMDVTPRILAWFEKYKK